jgi:hypothetical protein
MPVVIGEYRLILAQIKGKSVILKEFLRSDIRPLRGIPTLNGGGEGGLRLRHKIILN